MTARDALKTDSVRVDAISEEHFSIACIRAAASQTTLVRSVYDGWGAVIDSTRTPLTQSHTDETGFETILLYDVPVSPDVEYVTIN